MKRTNKKGFTIVELVVVIAVIAILAAVMIPTFSGVAGDAQEQADLANARNAYTQKLAQDPSYECDYVCDGENHFDVNNNFAVTDCATHAQDDVVLDISN